MVVEYPYSISCNSIEVQNTLIHIFSQWVKDLNIQLTKNGLETSDITVYKMKRVEGAMKIGDSIVEELFDYNHELREYLSKPTILNGLSIKILDIDGFYSNTISMVFIHRPNNKVNGFGIEVYHPLVEENDYDDDDNNEIIKILKGGFNDLHPEQDDDTSSFNTILERPCILSRHNIEWHKELLGSIASVSPEIRVNTSSNSFLSMMNGGTEIPQTNDYQKTLTNLADKYLSDCITWRG